MILSNEFYRTSQHNGRTVRHTYRGNPTFSVSSLLQFREEAAPRRGKSSIQQQASSAVNRVYHIRLILGGWNSRGMANIILGKLETVWPLNDNEIIQ